MAESNDLSGGSIDRVLGLMDLFTLEKPAWTVDDLVRETGMARATAYRYVKALCNSGLLYSTVGNAYALGPRMVQYDRQIRLSDPLLKVGVPLVSAVRHRVKGVSILCSYYGDRVLTVYGETSDPSAHSRMNDRGCPFTLFRSAASRIILANLSTYQLKNLMLAHPREIAEAGLGESWAEFSGKLKEIARAGYYAQPGDIDPENYGIAAPIFRGPRAVIGSFCIGRPLEKMSPRDRERLIGVVVDTAAKISQGLQESAGGA